MREARRLALLEKQAMIAGVARKQALQGLADAIESEARSHALASRSRTLVAMSAPAPGETTGAALTGRAAFTASLAQLAGAASAAADDAARQRAWQADVLAQAETRSRRLAERTAETRAALEAETARRAAQAEAAQGVPAMARKLQNRSGA